MKLRNKKTGEVEKIHNMETGDEHIYLGIVRDGKLSLLKYNSLAELNEEWEDYKEEPKRMWIIDTMNDCIEDFDVLIDSPFNKQIGNYFETREEAEKAVEKLKAWKRLKDKGFRFSDFYYTELCDYARINIKATMINDSINDDLNLLF